MARATKAKGRGEPNSEAGDLRLITHKAAADRCDITTEMWRDWVDAGEFPLPHVEVRRTWLYRADVVDEFIRTGRWPEGVRFKAGVGKGRVAPERVER
jgi:hypothetical protein